jgi:hypothetical protein
MSHDGLDGVQFDALVKSLMSPTTAVPDSLDIPPHVCDAVTQPAAPAPLPVTPVRPAPVKERAAGWLVSRTGIQTLAVSVGVPSATWGLAELAVWQSPGWTGAASAVMILGGGILSVSSMTKHFGNAATLTGVSVGVAGLQTALSVAPSFWTGLVGWCFATATAASLRVFYANGRKEPDARVRILEGQAQLVQAKVVTEQYKSQVQLAKVHLQMLKVQAAADAAQPEQVPVFPPTLEGRLQAALWAHTKQVTHIVGVTHAENGWAIEVLLGGALTKRLLEGKADVISETMALEEAFRVSYGSDHGSVILTYRERGSLPAVVGYAPDRNELAWDAPVRLGVDAYGDVVAQPLNIHSIVAGATGGGKSNALNLIVLQLASRRDVELIGIDLKPGAPEMRPLMPVLARLGNTLEAAREELERAIAEMHRRGGVLGGAGDKKWDPRRHGAPIRYIVMDEYAELVRADEAYRATLQGQEKAEYVTVKFMVETLAALSRFVGILLIMGTQTPDGTLFGDNTAARTNFPIRVVFRLMEQVHYRFALPADGGWLNALTDKAPGRFVLYSPEYDEPGMYASFRVADDPRDAELGLDPEQLRTEILLIAQQRAAWGFTSASDHAAEAARTPLDRVRRFLAAHPDASKRAVAEGAGVPEGSVQRYIVAVREGS